MEWGMILRKLRQVFVKIEYDGNGNDQQDGEDISTDKFLYNVPIQSFYVFIEVERMQKSQVLIEKNIYCLKPWQVFLQSFK